MHEVVKINSNKRLVEPFSISSYQKNTQVYALKKIDVFKEKPVYNSLFRRLFLRGDIPCHRSFEKYQEDGWTKEKFLKWKVESPQDLDYCYYLPIFFDGLCEKEFPYNMIARHAIHDLLNAGSNKILPVIRKLIMPIKYALGTKNCDVILATLRIIQHMCICDCNVAEALVPYFRQILPILNMYIGCNLNISDRIDYDRVGNISNVIEETLSILEHYGGPDAFINIKYCIPSYESYVNN